MNNLIIFFTLLLTYSNFHAKDFYAISTCEGETKSELIQRCKGLKLEVIAIMKHEDFVIVKSDKKELSSNFCYKTKLKTLDNHICFNTNLLIIKTNKKDEALIKRFNLKRSSFIPNLYYYKAYNEKEIEVVKNTLEHHISVRHVTYNQVFTLDAATNDPIFPRQWSINNTGGSLQYNGIAGADMSVDSAWTITNGSANIKIAILDSGVDTLHEDLISNMVSGFDGFADNNSNTNGAPTLDFTEEAHGTNCAGIVAAISNNNLGVAGIANNCKIVPVRVFYHQDYGSGIGVQPTTSTNSLLTGTAFSWRVANSDILSTSAGLAPIYISYLAINTQLINDEINDAYANARNGKGVAMFFSTGNDNSSDVLWPGYLENTIGVGASSMCDERKSATDCSQESWWGSNYGNGLDFVAPGVKIATTDITGTDGIDSGNYTNIFNGTSASCPNAAAVAALILSVNDTLSPNHVRHILSYTADKVPNYNYDSLNTSGTWNNEVGHGRINAFKAVQLALVYEDTVAPITTTISNNNDLQSILIYPNPVTDYINIVIPSNSTNNLVTIFNAIGAKVYEEKVAGGQPFRYYLGETKGLYYVKIKTNSYAKTYKIIRV